MTFRPLLPCLGAALFVTRVATAQEPPAGPADPPSIHPPTANLVPRPVEAKPVDAEGGTKTQFVADPVGDGAVLALAVGVFGVLELIQSTGEIRPQQPGRRDGVRAGLVSHGRVRSGKHFPTDVIAGGLAGAGVGALVPHLHRSDSAKSRPVWIGFSPAELGRGGELSASGAW